MVASLNEIGASKPTLLWQLAGTIPLELFARLLDCSSGGRALAPELAGGHGTVCGSLAHDGASPRN